MIRIFYLDTDVTPACRGKDPTLFVGPDGEDTKEREFREQEAKAICAGCPLIGECRTWAITNYEVGIWGGLNDDQRKSIRTGRRITDPNGITEQTRRRIEREKRAWELHEAGDHPVEEIAKILGVKPATVYEYLRSQRTIKGDEEDHGSAAEASNGEGVNPRSPNSVRTQASVLAGARKNHGDSGTDRERGHRAVQEPTPTPDHEQRTPVRLDLH